jgi:undecaprenyl-diphosphatase
VKRTEIRRGRRAAGAAGALGAGAAVIALLWPGGLGDPEPVRVRDGVSADVYRWLTGATADVPGVAPAGEVTLVALGLLTVWLAWTGLRRGDARRVAGAALTLVATLAAYGLSEAAKLVVDQERPCRVVTDAVAGCPPPGDWSFPSNHATLGAALAAGVALTVPRLAWPAVALGAGTALSRVAAGLHYPHDVTAGAALGAAVAVAVGLPLLPWAARRCAPAVSRWAAAGRVPPRVPSRRRRPGS